MGAAAFRMMREKQGGGVVEPTGQPSAPSPQKEPDPPPSPKPVRKSEQPVGKKSDTPKETGKTS